MRVTGGQARGRHLIGPQGRLLRPTSDLVREALFQILTVRLEFSWESCRVLDLFAGTGALGIEALSRGAREAVFVDNHRQSIELIRQNLSTCGFSGRASVIRAGIGTRRNSLKRVLDQGPYKVIFADPPYSRGLGLKALEWVDQTGMLASDGWMVVEGFKTEELPKEITPHSGTECRGHGSGSRLDLVESRRYGQTELWFYRSIQCNHQITKSPNHQITPAV